MELHVNSNSMFLVAYLIGGYGCALMAHAIYVRLKSNRRERIAQRDSILGPWITLYEEIKSLKSFAVQSQHIKDVIAKSNVFPSAQQIDVLIKVLRYSNWQESQVVELFRPKPQKNEVYITESELKKPDNKVQKCDNPLHKIELDSHDWPEIGFYADNTTLLKCSNDQNIIAYMDTPETMNSVHKDKILHHYSIREDLYAKHPTMWITGKKELCHIPSMTTKHILNCLGIGTKKVVFLHDIKNKTMRAELKKREDAEDNF